MHRFHEEKMSGWCSNWKVSEIRTIRWKVDGLELNWRVICIKAGMKIHECSCSFVFDNFEKNHVRVRSCSIFPRKTHVRVRSCSVFSRNTCSCSFIPASKWTVFWGIFHENKTRLIHDRPLFKSSCLILLDRSFSPSLVVYSWLNNLLPVYFEIHFRLSLPGKRRAFVEKLGLHIPIDFISRGNELIFEH